MMAESSSMAGAVDTDPAAAPILVVRDLRVDYGLATALHSVDLAVARGRAVAILGANGAGKTTLARTISGLVPAKRGRITFDGADITRWPAHRVARRQLAHVPADRLILPGMTVLENLKVAVRHSCPRPERRQAIERALTYFPRLAERRSQLAGKLSGGEQQMLSLARILAVPPALLIADELSHGLAPLLVEQVFDSLRLARAEGVTMLVIEQFVGAVLDLADDAVILRRGEVVWTGEATAAKGALLEHYL